MLGEIWNHKIMHAFPPLKSKGRHVRHVLYIVHFPFISQSIELQEMLSQSY